MLIGRLNLLYFLSGGAIFMLLLLITLAWRRRRRRRLTYHQMMNYRNAIYAQVSALADTFDDLLEGAGDVLSNWAISRGAVRRFLSGVKRIAADMGHLQEQVVEQSVPKDLVAAKGSMLRALNELEKYIDNVLAAVSIEEALDIIGGSSLQEGIGGLQAMDEALQDYATRYKIRLPAPPQ